MKRPALKILLVAGARPNFMKVAPLLKAMTAHHSSGGNGHATFDGRLVHTGQHYDAAMSGVFFKELGIPAPHVNLEVGSGSHAVQTANIMLRFEPVLQAEKPDWLVVVGDVNSTMACALVASKFQVKVAHLEAGLRSFDRAMPEEINRIVTDSISDLLLTPSEDADENLFREGAPAKRIKQVGNIMIDALVANLDQARSSRLPERLGIKGSPFVYVTLHRPSNVDEKASLMSIMKELTRLSRRIFVVFPIHPRTRRMLGEFGISVENHSNLKILDPIGYHDSLCLAENARFVLTDSGGLQEETTHFRTPCLTLRPNTERPITVRVGSNRLTSTDRLPLDIEEILSRPARLGQAPELWDGQTAGRVLQALIHHS